MLTILIIASIIASTVLAFNGLLYQPKKDPDGPTTWRNINSHGKVVFGLLLFLGILAITQTIYTSINQQKELRELKEKNDHLLKVMSVADGYNALITGVVMFERPTTEDKIRAALQNLFLKYVRIDLAARNKFGIHTGRIDYGAHPEVRKFLRLDTDGDSKLRNRYREYLSSTSYFFEIRCSRLKILNDEKIQYAKIEQQEPIDIQVNPSDMYRDFQRLYNIRNVFIGDLRIEELGDFQLNQRINMLN